MVCLGLKPGVAGWKAQTNSLSYSATPTTLKVLCDKFLYKRSPNILQIMGLFWNVILNKKNFGYVLFGQVLEKLGKISYNLVTVISNILFVCNSFVNFWRN